MGRAERIDLAVYKYTEPAGWQLEFTKDNIGKNISGWTIYFTVKESLNDADASAVISKDITTHTNENSGKTLISLTESDLDGLTVGTTYWYDIKYKDDSGNMDILFYGHFEVLMPATRRTS